MVSIFDIFGDFITAIGQIGLGLQALGIVVVVTIVFNIIAFILNRKRLKSLEVIQKDMVRIENKIDAILKKT